MAAKEALALPLHTNLLVSLDKLLAKLLEFINQNVLRSVRDRCQRFHGVGNLCDLQARKARLKPSGFKAYELGFVHINVK